MADDLVKASRTGVTGDEDRPGLPFLLGIYGIEPSGDTVRHLIETGACGVVLRRRNINEPAQVVRQAKTMIPTISRWLRNRVKRR